MSPAEIIKSLLETQSEHGTSTRLVDRLRGNYACGPHLPNGRPEFGWRQFQAPPIQHEAAAAIEALVEKIRDLQRDCWHLISMVDFISEATGEGLEIEDAAILHQIKADLPPETIEPLPGALIAEGVADAKT